MQKGSLARATILTTGVLLLRMLVQAGSLLVMARLLGPDGFGVLTGVSALAVLAGAVATLGTHLIVLREMSRDPSRGRSVLSFSIPLTVLCGSFLLVLFWAVIEFWFAQVTFGWGGILLIGVAEIVLQPLLQLSVMACHGRGEVARSQMLALFPMILRFVAIVMLLFVGVTSPIAWYGVICILSSSAALLLGKFMVRKVWPELREYYIPQFQVIRDSAGYAVLNISALGVGEADKAIALKFLSPSMAGLYSVATRVVGAVSFPVFAMILSALPKLFQQTEGKQSENLQLKKFMLLAAILYGVVVAFFMWHLASFVAGFFGGKYVGLVDVIQWATIVIPVMMLRMTIGAIVMAQEQPWVRAKIEIVGAFVLYACAALIVTSYGINGMVLSLFVAESCMVFLGALSMLHKVKSHKLSD